MFANARRRVVKNFTVGALKSDYAKRIYDFIPTWIISYILRTIFDFMFYHRFKIPIETITDAHISLKVLYYLFNMFIAVVVSVGVTMCSPFFYDVVWQYEDHIKKLTNHVADHMTWDYYYTWQTRIVVIIAAIAIAILSYVEVTSSWIIECIIHTLVCGFILTKYEELREHISKPAPVYWEYVEEKPRIYKYQVVKAHNEYHVLKSFASTSNIKLKHPSRAKVININNYIQNYQNFQTLNLTVKKTIMKVKNLQINVFADYDSSISNDKQQRKYS